MKKIFHSEWKYGHKVLYLTIFLCFSIIASYNLNKGFVMSSDSETFSTWADDLIELSFNLYSYYAQNTFINPNYFYSTPIILIALSKSLFGINWENAFITINLLLVFFSFIIFSKSLLILNVRPLVVSIGVLILLLSVDLLVWPRYILTDTIFSFLVNFLLYLIIKSIVKKHLNYLYFFLIIILIYFTRPSSIPFILVAFFFIIISKFQIKFSLKLISIFFVLLCITTPFILALIYQLMEPYLTGNPRADYLIKMIKKGIIIHDRPETWVDSPKSFFDIVCIYYRRFLIFFSPYAKDFSIIHIFLNLVYVLIVLFSISAWFVIREKNNQINKVLTLILLIAISVANFHSFTLIDYDWRYRFPIIMPTLMLLPLAIEIVLRKIYVKKSKYQN